MMLRTPFPSSPTIQARAPRSSVSQEALATFAHFVFQLLNLNRVLVPSGRHRGRESRKAPLSMRQNKERITHGGGDKVLVPTSS